MNIINAKQLAWLLDIDSQEAAGKIIYCHNKEFNLTAKGRELDEALDKNGKYSEKNPCTAIANIEKHLGIDLKAAIQDIERNYFVRSATRGWIIQYPQTLLARKAAKVKLPKAISIPDPLKTFLPDSTRQAIVEMWQDKYEWYTKAGGTFKTA
jgi:hypothetical protein